MSALGSSVINKSGKKFAPRKAPVRRPAQDSASASARPSVDRQTQSQTPQPQSSVHLVASSPAPSLTLSTSGATQESSQVARTSASQEASAVRIPIPTRSTPAPRQTSSSSLNPRKRSFETLPQVTSPDPSDSPAITQRTSSNVTQQDDHNLVSNIGSTRTPQRSYTNDTVRTSVSTDSQAPRDLTAPRTAQPTETPKKPAKRRRTRELQSGESPVEGGHPVIGPNVPIPTTEVDDVNAQADSGQATNTVHPGPKATQSKRRVLRGNKEPVRSTFDERQGPEDTTLSSEEADTMQGTQTQSSTGRKKPRRPRTRDRQQVIEDAATEIVRDAIEGSTKDPKKRRRKSKRSPTPDDAENARIAPSETKMIELCRDIRKGRISLREQELREMDRAEFMKRKQRELQERMGQAESPSENGSAELSAAREERQERQQEREQAVALNVPNTIIVNGQIQIDEDSLQIDRHAVAAAKRNIEQLEPVDENDLSRKITSASWLKRDRSGGWNEILLNRFYRGLRMFGTDFELISKMFPGKTRHAIKLKFCKEEKLDYSRIKAALMGEKVPVVLEEYERITGVEYEDPKELERMMDEDRQKLEEEQAAEKQALEDAQQEREAQAAAERAAADEESGKEGSGKGKKKKEVKERQRKAAPDHR